MGTTAQKLQAILDSKADIASAIEEKGGTVPTKLSDYGDAIRALPSGGDDPREHADVLFIDYDGEIIAAKSKSEFLADPTLPQLPSHDGMTNQGWNHTVFDITSALNAGLKVTVGCNYCSSDGKSYITIDLSDEDAPLTLKYMSVTVCSIGESVTLDFGDGSTDSSASATRENQNFNRFQHTYAQHGVYTISVSVTSGNIQWDTPFFVADTSLYNNERLNSLIVGAVFGSNVNYLAGSFFTGAYNLHAVPLPSNITTIWSNEFMKCANVPAIVIPRGVSRIYNHAFRYCRSMKFVSLPVTISSIGGENTTKGYSFDSCISLIRLDIPNGIGQNTDPKGYTFSNLPRIKEITVPATLDFMRTADFMNDSSVETVTILGDMLDITQSMFNGCTSVKTIKIVGIVNGVYKMAFQGCASLEVLDLRGCTSVPTLESVDAFVDTPWMKKIIVPTELYDSWIAATNWSSTTNGIKNAIVKASEA